jgi:hypothetical protein
MAPLAAIIAETPQMEDPMASSEVSFGDSRSHLPSAVISAIDTASSMATNARLTPPNFRMSPSRKRTPSNTIPVFSQNS